MFRFSRSQLMHGTADAAVGSAVVPCICVPTPPSNTGVNVGVPHGGKRLRFGSNAFRGLP